MHPTRALLAWLLVGWLPAPGLAQGMPAPPEFRAARAQGPIALDGRLDEPAWAAAPPLGGFVQTFPQAGAAPTCPSEVRVLYDQEALYVGARLGDPRPEAILARVARRDEWVEADSFRVEIDSRLDRRTGLWFEVSAAGTRLDGALFDERNQSFDWDGVWAAEVARDEAGWSVEIRIPLKLLRYQPGAEVRFGVFFARYVSRLHETSSLPYIPPESGLRVSRFAVLSGLSLPGRPLELDVIPFTLARLGWGEGSGQGLERALDAGLDARLGLGGRFMLTLAVNPDFGQVEADPAVLNLSTYETFYPEKRPFFLEDQALFQPASSGGMTRLFYTRRIGRAPRTPDGADDEELVTEAPVPSIYAAAKLAGQTEDGLSLGFIQALSGEALATFARPGGQRVRRVAEPLTSYSAARLKQDFWDHSSVGLMLLGLATPLDGSAVTGGADARVELGGGDYHLLASAVWSYLTPERRAWHDEFTRAGIERDGPFGYGAELMFSKDGGEHVLGQASLRFRSRALALNDLGYQDRPDVLESVAKIQYRELEPRGPLSRYGAGLSLWMRRNQAGQALGQGFWVDGWVLLAEAWNLGAWFGVDQPACDDRETRTAGRVVFCWEQPWIGGGAWLGTDASRVVSAGLDFSSSNTERGAGFQISLRLSAHPWDRLQLSLTPVYSRWTGSLRWVDGPDASGRPGAPGQPPFVFADRLSESWDVTLRLSLTLTRDLTFQLYTQVYLASVDHREKLEAAWPADGKLQADALRPAPGAPDDYDYAYAAWNLNAVVRWEFAPGSVGFLVYSLGLGQSGEQPEFRFGRSLAELVEAAGAHALMLKLSFLFG
jgi:hypothetical protein